MSDVELCRKCFGVGSIEIRPDQIGMLRRPELEQPEYRSVKIQVYEHPNGELQAVHHPYRLRVLCPVCRKDMYRRRIS